MWRRMRRYPLIEPRMIVRSWLLVRYQDLFQELGFRSAFVYRQNDYNYANCAK